MQSANVADSDRELTLVRHIEVPARILFTAWSTPQHLLEWFGPKGYPLTLCEVDFRVGGKYRFAMTGPPGVQSPAFGGEYLAIEPNRKIQFSNRFERPDAETMIVTVTFDEKNGKTTMVHHTLFGSIAMKKSQVEMGIEVGLGLSLDQLADVVLRLARS